MRINPITGSFSRTQRINGWAKLIHVTAKMGHVYPISHERPSTPFIIEEPIVTIENKPCSAPFVAIRKWKRWVYTNPQYNTYTCYY